MTKHDALPRPLANPSAAAQEPATQGQPWRSRLVLAARVVLLLAMVRFSFQALIGYAFDFREYGYPLWPLLALGLCFAVYLRLRPRVPAPVEPVKERDFSSVDHTFLLLILSVVSSAFLLDKRGEDPFTPTYFLHLSTLTLFLLLLPFIAACGFGRARAFVTAVATLILMFFLLDGTMKDPEPVIAYFTEARAYDKNLNGSQVDLIQQQPILIIPPATPPPAP